MEIKAVLPRTTSLAEVVFAHGRENYKRLVSDSKAHATNVYVFSTDVGDRIWETFLEALPVEYRDTWRCSCCKEFVRKYGAYVVSYRDPESQLARQAPLFFFQSEALSGAPELQPAFAACEALLKTAKLVTLKGIYKYESHGDLPLVLGKVTKGQRADGGCYEHLYIPGFIRKYEIYHNDWDKHKIHFYDLFHRPQLDRKLKAAESLIEHLAVKHNKRSSNLAEYLEQLKKFHIDPSDDPDFVNEYEFQYRILSSSQWLIHYNSNAVSEVIDKLVDDRDLEAAVRRLSTYTHFTTYRRPQEASVTQLEKARNELRDKGLMQYLQLRHTRAEELDWHDFANDPVTTASDETPADVISGLFEGAIKDRKPTELAHGKRQLASGKKTMSFQKFLQSLQDGEITELYEIGLGTRFSVLRSQVDAEKSICKSKHVMGLSVHWVTVTGPTIYNAQQSPAFTYKDYGIAGVVEDWNRGIPLIPVKGWVVSETDDSTFVVLRYESTKAPEVDSPFLVTGDSLNGEFYPYRAAIQWVSKLVPDDGVQPVVVTSHGGRMGSIDDLPQPHEVDDSLFAVFKGSDVIWRLSIIG